MKKLILKWLALNDYHELQSMIGYLKDKQKCKGLKISKTFCQRYNINYGSISAAIIGHIEDLEKQIEDLKNK